MRRGIVASAKTIMPLQTYHGSYLDTSSLSAYTFSNVPIGEPDPNRTVIVGAASYTGGNRVYSYISIAGVNAKLDRQSPSTWYPTVIASRVVPTGATADIVVVVNSTVQFMALFVWTVNKHVVNHGSNGIFANPGVSFDVPVMPNGVTLAASLSNTTVNIQDWTDAYAIDSEVDERRAYALLANGKTSGAYTIGSPDGLSMAAASYGEAVPMKFSNIDGWIIGGQQIQNPNNGNLSYLLDAAGGANFGVSLGYSIRRDSSMGAFASAEFNGNTSTYLRQSGLTQTDPNQTLSYVLKPDASGDIRVLSKRVGTGYAFGMNALDQWYIEYNGAEMLTAAGINGEWCIVTFVIDQINGTNSIRLNGQTVASIQNDKTLTGGGQYPFIGYSATGQSFDGLIAELVRYTKALSSNELLELETYFSNKYGIPLS